MTKSKIQGYLGISSLKLDEVLSFLLKKELINFDSNFYSLGVKNTHLPGDSELIINHHKNWRLKAIERQHFLQQDDLSFSAPISLSKDDFEFIRSELLSAIEKISTRVNNSPPEMVGFLNIDLLRMN